MAAAAAAPAASTAALSPAEQDALKAATFRRLHPRAYLERFLAEGARPDARAPATFRALSAHTGSIGTADGSALVRLGATTIVCGVKAEIAEPALDHPDDGFLVPNLDLPALCSPQFRPGPPSEEAQVLSARLAAALTAARVLPLEALSIAPARAAWVLYVDAVCINYDGNAFDATLAAMVAALRNTRLPVATFDPETGLTTCSRTERVPLALGGTPLAVSFGLFDRHILADPTAFEEPLIDTTVSVVLASDGTFVSVSQLGPGAVGQDVLSACLAAAKARHADLKSIYDA